MQLTADAIYGFTTSVLLQRFDNPQPTPDFHKELWTLATRPERYVAIAAPRGHAKSTAITHSYVLACVLFRARHFVIIVSDTEGQAIQFLGDIKRELVENEELIRLFGVRKLIKDTESDIIVEFVDGQQFRIIAKGSEQKVRGLKWRNKRPDLIVGDDLENDEIVLNEERRFKFRNWLFNALIPSLSDNGIVRLVGTILHLDSALERLMPPLNDPKTVNEELKAYSTDKKRTWLSVRYKAHNEDFSSILWPDKFPEERLREIQQVYIEQGNPEGYAQEYLNYPIDEATAYFRKQDFLPIKDEVEPLEYYAAADLAISQKDGRAYTVIAVAGRNSYGILKFVDIRRFRADAKGIIDEIFSVQQRYNPELFVIEQENIARSIGPFLNEKMIRDGIFINLLPVVVTQDKEKRARTLQARMRAGSVEFDFDAEWFPELQTEFLQFPKGKYADQVDACAHIGLALDKMIDAPTRQELAQAEYEEELESTTFLYDGRSSITGY